MRRATALAALLLGCTKPAEESVGWPMGAEYGVEVVGSPAFSWRPLGASDREVWETVVASSVRDWQDALGPWCPFPFRRTWDPPERDSRLIRVWDESSWLSYQDPDGGSFTTHGGIEVREAGDPEPLMLRATVTHEIGHALGLGHSDRPDSVMASWNGSNAFPDLEDGREARESIGCEEAR